VSLLTAGHSFRWFLSDELRDAIYRRLREIAGLVALAAAGVAAAALASWSVNDPSLSHATSAPVRNLFGSSGAVAADLAMQLFGIAAIALILPPGFWGWRLISHRPLDRWRWRIAAWLVGLVAAAGFASCLPPTAHWPLPTGIGGVVGDAVLRFVAGFVPNSLDGLGHTILKTALGTIGCAALLIAAGFAFHRAEQPVEGEGVVDRRSDPDDDEEDRGSVRIGWLVHSLLSTRARILRFVGSMAAAARARILAPFRRPGSRGWQRTEPWVEAGRRAGDSLEAAGSANAIEAVDSESAETSGRARRSSRRSARGSGPSGNAVAKYEPPSLGLLAAPRASDRAAPSVQTIRENATALEHVLADFGVRGEIINARPGPVVTLYELEPAPGIKSSRVIGLADDIARSMSALSARVAVVSGRNAIGIELPNPTREKVYLRELLAAEEYAGSSAKLALCLGKTIGGEAVIVDLARMPHLLIAGTTGSGKSVAINTMILSLLYRLPPHACRLIMVDPKMLELSVYDGIPHLLAPVVTDPKKAVVALKWAVREMEDRYRKMAKLGVRNIEGYNARLAEARDRGEVLCRTVHTGYDRESGEAIYEKEEFDQEPLPFLVVIVDEMADLMMVAGKDIEGAIQRLAQMARAAGIHVILATQRPSVDVITGTIKANFPTRISFQVTSKIDSRTILGEQGAEQLLGQGDMLYMAGGGRISRVHGPFVSDEEVEKIVRHLKTQGQPEYLDAVTADDDEEGENAGEGSAVFDATAMGASEAADLYSQAVEVVTRDRKASTSYIQRRLQIGYNRAASLIERMEQEGVVGRPNHAGKREILVGGEDDER
jgi:S-DNA-T family DNA segregation ATPase FtsK/SpoIIIE